MRRPLDIATLMEGIDETSLQTAHDPIRTRPSLEREAREDVSGGNLRSPAQGPTNPAEAIPEAPAEDAINPSHYRRHPSGIECIEITRHLNFNVGNAIKYLWRHMDKGDPVENLKKAQWYIDDEIRRLEGLR